MAFLAVAVSGGADSLYALLTLHEQGHRLVALHGRFLPPAEDAPDPLPGLREICRRLDIPLHVVDLARVFDSAVIRPFVEDYLAGQTPNPCAHCNRCIKFGRLYDAARALGAEGLATGHYAARIAHPDYGFALRQGTDSRKDQSYFLALVPRNRLYSSVFPLADREKADVVAALQEQGIAVPLSGESQDICFVPEDYRTFLVAQARARGLMLPEGGAMLLSDGRVVGRHNGLWRYTEGQRRGLSVAWSEPLFVLGKDCRRNALLLGTRRELGIRGCRTGRANLLVPQARWPRALFARVRYRQREEAAEVTLRDGCLYIAFHQSQPPSAPGQLAAIYDASGVLLAGGVIEEVFGLS